MKLLLKLLLSVATAGVFLATAAGNPTKNQTPEVEHRSIDPLPYEENSFPYYGGLQGHFLHLRKESDGTVNTFIVAPAPIDPVTPKTITTQSPKKTNKFSPNRNTFHEDFDRIQLAAARLVAIQEMAKRTGAFSEADNKYYADSLLELGQAAQNLATLQQTGQIRDFGALLQTELMMPQKQPLSIADEEEEDNSEAVHIESDNKPDEVTEQHVTELELRPPANTEDPYEDVSDSVAVLAPKKDASVAEAKPVGLSIAGEGGVASSKPNAVALTGRNGLAVSSPKATALAGVSAEEAAAFSISMPSRDHIVIKTAKPGRRRYSEKRPVYDDYDYNDLVPVRSTTREASRPLKLSPAHEADIWSPFNIISQWKVDIAEDATSPIISGRSKNQEKPRRNTNNKMSQINNDDGPVFYVP